MRTLAVWQSMILFWRPPVSTINPACILCYMKVSFRTFKIAWNTYFLNYLCKTWSHGQYLIDSIIAHFSKSLTLANVYAFILSKLLIVYMGFPRLGAALSTEAAHECTSSQLYDVRHAWFVVSECRALDSRHLKCCLQLTCYRAIWESIISRNTKQIAVSEIRLIKYALQMYC